MQSIKATHAVLFTLMGVLLPQFAHFVLQSNLFSPPIQLVFLTSLICFPRKFYLFCSYDPTFSPSCPYPPFSPLFALSSAYFPLQMLDLNQLFVKNRIFRAFFFRKYLVGSLKSSTFASAFEGHPLRSTQDKRSLKRFTYRQKK